MASRSRPLETRVIACLPCARCLRRGQPVGRHRAPSEQQQVERREVPSLPSSHGQAEGRGGVPSSALASCLARARVRGRRRRLRACSHGRGRAPSPWPLARRRTREWPPEPWEPPVPQRAPLPEQAEPAELDGGARGALVARGELPGQAPPRASYSRRPAAARVRVRPAAQRAWERDARAAPPRCLTRRRSRAAAPAAAQASPRRAAGRAIARSRSPRRGWRARSARGGRTAASCSGKSSGAGRSP